MLSPQKLQSNVLTGEMQFYLAALGGFLFCAAIFSIFNVSSPTTVVFPKTFFAVAGVVCLSACIPVRLVFWWGQEEKAM